MDGSVRVEGRLSAIVGFAAFLVVTDFLLWGAAFAPVDGVSPFPWDQIHRLYSIPNTFVLGLALVALSYIGGRLRAWGRSLPDLPLLAIACLGVVAGIAILGLQVLRGSGSSVLLVIASVCSGVGMALGLLAWQKVFVGQDASRLASTVLTAFLPFPLVAIGCIFMPRAAAYAVALVFALASFALAGRLLTSTGRATASPTSHDPSTVRERTAGWGATYVCLGSFGFVAGVLRSLTLYAVDNRLEVTVGSLVCVFAATSVLFVIWHVRKACFSLGQFYQVGFPLIAGGLVVFAVVSNDFSAVLAGLAHFLLEFSLIVIVVQSIRESCARGQDAVEVYGLAVGCAYTLLGLGTVVGLVFRQHEGGAVSTFGLAVIVCIYALAIPLALQLYRRSGKGEPSEDRGADLDARQLYAQRLRAAAVRYGLTPREEEVVSFILAGRDTPSIAAELGLSDNTVRTHKKNAYRKLDVHSKQDIITVLNAAAKAE